MVQLTERIPGFVRLDDKTSLYQPPKARKDVPTLENPQTEPDLIVVCSWMSAAPKHIKKYTDGYRRLFPNTAILLVEARLGDMLARTPLSAACTTIAPHIAAKAPLAHRTCPSIILHASSNGGANTAATLATLLKDQGLAAPFDTLTLDCAPGKAEFRSAARAITLSVPDVPFARAVAGVAVYVLLALYWLANTVTGADDKITGIRRTLNDRAVLGVDVPRLYLYSRADPLVEWQHVHEHAAHARGKGCGGVREEDFATAPHCALLNEDAGRYWGAVEELIRTGGGERPFRESSWAPVR